MDKITKKKGYRDLIVLVSNVDFGNLSEVIDNHNHLATSRYISPNFK